jgi:hypothetical protein
MSWSLVLLLVLQGLRARPSSHYRREHPLWALFMGFEHERIHLETSSVLIRELPLALLDAARACFQPILSAQGRGSQSKSFWPVPAGAVRIGKSSDVPTFGWDNEYGERLLSCSCI